MTKSKIILHIAMFFVFTSCMQFKYAFISPGRVKYESLKAHVNQFNSVSDSITGIKNGNYEVIGHGITSWRNYPMGVSKRGYIYGNNETRAVNINKLIDNSIALDSTISIELDAQYVPINDTIRKIYPNDGSYILHDIPDWGSNKLIAPEVLTYFHDNTIKRAVDYFVAKKYYHKSKMYLEIKVSEMDFKNCDAQCKALALELTDYAKFHSRYNKENWLCITSFSPYALEKFRSSIPEEIRNSFDYILIAGYTGGWPKSVIAQSKGYVPKFDQSIISFVKSNEWLNCIWFSPQGIKEFKQLFSEIVKARRESNPTWKEISFSFSTYQKKEKKMRKLLLKNPDKRIKIRSFMIDFDDIIKL